MLVIGAGGFAAQLLEDMIVTYKNDLVFWSETETRYSFLKETISNIKD